MIAARGKALNQKGKILSTKKECEKFATALLEHDRIPDNHFSEFHDVFVVGGGKQHHLARFR